MQSPESWKVTFQRTSSDFSYDISAIEALMKYGCYSEKISECSLGSLGTLVGVFYLVPNFGENKLTCYHR